MSPTRARTWTTRSGVECTNHEATASPTILMTWDQNFNTLFMTIVLQLSVSQHIILEKVTSSKQHTGTIQDLSTKTIPSLWTKWPNLIPLIYDQNGWNHTLTGKDITIPLRANPKQANPDLLELPKEIDPQASIGVKTTQRNVRKDFRITPYIYDACRVINYVCTLLF